MESKKTPAAKGKSREDRLKAALKANMGRRKAQAKARAAGPQETQQKKTDEG